jgi:hypothetical protein
MAKSVIQVFCGFRNEFYHALCSVPLHTYSYLHSKYCIVVVQIAELLTISDRRIDHIEGLVHLADHLCLVVTTYMCMMMINNGIILTNDFRFFNWMVFLCIQTIGGSRNFNPLHGREDVFISRSTTCLWCILYVVLVFSAFKWTYILLSTDRELSEKDIMKVYFVSIFT